MILRMKAILAESEYPAKITIAVSTIIPMLKNVPRVFFLQRKEIVPHMRKTSQKE
jgi:hypothetical protein